MSPDMNLIVSQLILVLFSVCLMAAEPERSCGELDNIATDLRPGNLRDFAQNLNAINSYYDETGIGLQIHDSCLKNYGSKFRDFVIESFDAGFACLKNLNSDGSSQNLSLLKDLVHSRKLKIFCQEDFNGKLIDAHGSMSESDSKPEIGLLHPYISINPRLKLGEEQKNWIKTPAYMRRLIFHEAFHVIGYTHGLTIDYAYACEECCNTLEKAGRNAFRL